MRLALLVDQLIKKLPRERKQQRVLQNFFLNHKKFSFIRKYYDELYTDKMDNPKEMDNSLET